MSRMALGAVPALVLLAALPDMYVMRIRRAPASAAGLDWQGQRRAPTHAPWGYWVGHSPMEARADTAEGICRLRQTVGARPVIRW
jgi:hypothetical protein